jgi:glycosyltransferase involved in cell wall biosynthesis
MKVLYLYSGSRKDKFKGTIGLDYSDTQFYGLNHLGDCGIDAEYKEFSDFSLVGRFDRFVPFRLKHLILMVRFSLSSRYDLIFGSSLLYGLFLNRLLPLKPKFAIFGIAIGRTLAANRHKPVKLALLRWLLGGADAIITLSHVQKAQLEKRLPALRGRIFFVPLGVDVRYHKPVYVGRKRYLLSVGRDNGRDYRTVFETARLLPEVRFEIVCSPRNLIGLGPVPANVEICFDLPQSQVYAKFSEAAALLLMTHDDAHEDGSDCSGQTVLVEAMASGLPIIASRKAYITDYVTDGADALLVDFYDPKDIVLKLAMLEDGALAERLARHARASAEKRFSTKDLARGLAEIFERLVNRSRAN